MSRFWERIVRTTPRFPGAPEQVRANIDSHRWRKVDLERRYGIAGLKPSVECSVCNVLAESNAATYPCGSEIPSFTYEGGRS